MVNVFGGSHRGGMRGPRGPPGPQGPIGSGKRGPPGILGPPGIDGSEGPPGKVGKIGPRGSKGDVGPKGDRGENGTIGPAGNVGPKGDSGAIGPVGPVGPKGDQGEHGSAGEDGVVGPTGDQGPTGVRGPVGRRGNQGAKGDQGVRGEQGPVGEQGPKGDTGIDGPRGSNGLPGSIDDMCRWMPKTVLKNLHRKEEDCYWVVKDKSKDLKYDGNGNIMEWISRTGENNAITDDQGAVSPIKDLIELVDGRYALVFKRNRYYYEDFGLVPHHDNIRGYLCITFRTSHINEMALLTSYTDAVNAYVEIYVDASKIGILSYNDSDGGKSSHAVISHRNQDWTTLFMEYSSTSDHTTRYKYTVVNNKDSSEITGDFTMRNLLDPIIGGLMGGRSDDSRFFVGDIACFEAYHMDKNRNDDDE